MYKLRLIFNAVMSLAPLVTTMALALIPIMPQRWMVYVVGAWCLMIVLRASDNAYRWPKGAAVMTLCMASPFIVMLLDLFRAHDLSAGWDSGAVSSAFLVFPVTFLLFGAPSSPRFRDAMMDVFSIAALALAMGTNVLLVVQDLMNTFPAEETFSNRYRFSFAMASGLNPPYASYFFLAGALFQAHFVLRKGRLFGVSSILMVALVAAASLVASITPLVAFVIALSFMIIKWKGLPVQRAVVLLAPLLLVALSASPSLWERTSNVLHTRWEVPNAVQRNAVNERVAIAHCSTAALKENWVLGIGQAQVQPTLDACYEGLGLGVMSKFGYGTRCQPLHWWLSYGIIGLVMVILVFMVPFISAWRAGHTVHMGFLIFMFLCCLTANMLERPWGAFLFACFNALFVSSNLHGDEAA